MGNFNFSSFNKMKEIEKYHNDHVFSIFIIFNVSVASLGAKVLQVVEIWFALQCCKFGSNKYLTFKFFMIIVISFGILYFNLGCGLQQCTSMQKAW